ncbi:MAG: hypothetical protein A2Z72_00295 [Omnitrophica bacterium RBG_13_46_9]|nr:MAG: hypothetical protein A2Z72_00295 [Omnitrophica bacterium RBG_13_46_9]
MLKEIISRCSELDIYEKRCSTFGYYEIVFYSKDTDRWNVIFAEILGNAIKPAGKKPTECDLRLTKSHNGIRENQTLFKKEFKNATVIAMFWPWENGIFTTLKVAVLDK